MYTKVLVAKDFEDGRRLLDALPPFFSVIAAFWLYFEEANEWRLVLVSPVVGEQGRRFAYQVIGKVLSDLQIAIPLENISVLSKVNLRYKQVLQAFRGAPSGLTVAPAAASVSTAADAYVYFADAAA